jgi:uncharacterized membrane protein
LRWRNDGDDAGPRYSPTEQNRECRLLCAAGEREWVMDGLAAARALHVLAVVIWIGGVWLVTMVALPAIRRAEFGPDRLRTFQAIERRFVWHARTAIITVGATGLYMAAQADLWDRFLVAEFWWMHLMVGVWALFALVLFVIEPFVLHRRLHHLATTDPERFFARLQRTHWVLLALSLVTILGAVAGSHGWSVF